MPEPLKFKPGRPNEAYLAQGWGPHDCLGREISIAAWEGMIRLVAGLNALRPAPSDMGVLKYIVSGPLKQRMYLSENWAALSPDPLSKSASCSFLFVDLRP